jgi:hypothetical protein
MGHSKNNNISNFTISKGDNYICFRKVLGAKYTLEDIKEISKSYKYIYKTTKLFSIDNNSFNYATYIISDVFIENCVFDFFNNINTFTYLINLRFLTLYNIKDKIEIL